MENKEDDIEGLFRKRFTNEEADVSPKVWQNISRTLPPNNGEGIHSPSIKYTSNGSASSAGFTKGILLWSITTVLAVSVCVGSYLYYTKEQSSSNLLTSQQEQVANHQDVSLKNKSQAHHQIDSSTDHMTDHTNKNSEVRFPKKDTGVSVHQNLLPFETSAQKRNQSFTKNHPDSNAQSLISNRKNNTPIVQLKKSTEQTHLFKGPKESLSTDHNDDARAAGSTLLSQDADPIITANKTTLLAENTKVSDDKLYLDKDHRSAEQLNHLATTPQESLTNNEFHKGNLASKDSASIASTSNTNTDSSKNIQDSILTVSSTTQHLRNDTKKQTDSISDQLKVISSVANNSLVKNDSSILDPLLSTGNTKEVKTISLADSTRQELATSNEAHSADSLQVIDSLAIPADSSLASADSLQQAAKDSLKVKEKKKTNLLNRLTLDGIAAALITGAETKATDTLYQAAVNDKNENDKNSYGYMAGLIVNYKLSNRLQISMGILYSSYSEQIIFHNRYYDTIWKGVDIQKKDQYGFLSIPLQVSYAFVAQEKIRLSAKAGMYTNILLSGVTYLPNATKTDVVGIKSGFNSISLHYMVALEAEYKLSPHTALLLQPTFLYAASSVHSKASALNQKLYGIGITLGLRFTF